MDRSFLSYQFVGATNGLHEEKSPFHIKNISDQLGFEERDRTAIEEFLPFLKGLKSQRISNPNQIQPVMSPSNDKSYRRYKSVGDKKKISSNISPEASRQQKINWLRKKVNILQEEKDALMRTVQSQPNVSPDVSSDNLTDRSVFEDYFVKLPIKFHSQKQKLKEVQSELASLKQQLFMVEQIDEKNKPKLKYFFSPNNLENQKIQLSDLTTKLPDLQKMKSTHYNGKKNQFASRRMAARSRVSKPLQIKEYDSERKTDPSNSVILPKASTIRPKSIHLITSRLIQQQQDQFLPLHTFHPDQQIVSKEFSDFSYRNPVEKVKITKFQIEEDQLINEAFITDDDGILLTNTNPSNKIFVKDWENENTLIKPITSSYIQLLNSKIFKYNILYTQFLYIKYKQPKRRRISFKIAIIMVIFTVKLIYATKFSMYLYQKMSTAHHIQYFPLCNEDCLQFVNVTLVKQIFCKPQRIALLQQFNPSSPQQRIMQLQASVECVQEIYQKLLSGNFTNKLYKFLKCVSSQGYFGLTNFHSQYTINQLSLSQYFGYFDSEDQEQKKIIIFEFVILKNLIFYGLFFKVDQLYRQLKVDTENVYVVVAILLHVFQPDMNWKNLINKTCDGQQAHDHMKALSIIQNKIISELKQQDGLNIDLNQLKFLQNQWLEKILRRTE